MQKPARQFDAKTVRSAEALGVSPTDFVAFAAQGNAEALETANRGVELVMDITGSPESARAWLNASHPDLGGRTGKDAILAGRADALVTLLENALAGLPS